jgi:glycosyltransferase involved in cell wall biosynthesis
MSTESFDLTGADLADGGGLPAPMISVVIPLYNGRDFIAEAIESVVAQTLSPLEVIVVDDGSSDGSGEIAGAVDAPFPIKVLRQANRGQSAARNEGVRHASGEYVAFLDQDDLWRPVHLELLAAPMAGAPDVGWVYGDFDEVDGEGRLVSRGFIDQSGAQHPKQSLAQCLVSDLMILPSASLMRKSALLAIGGFDEDLCGYEDDELFLRMFRADWRNVFVPTSVTRFRVHGSSSSAGRRFLQSRMRYLDKLQAIVPDDERLNRWWIRDLVAGRLFQSTLDDYVRALATDDWAYADEAYLALDRLAALMHPSWRRRVELALLAKPQRGRSVLRAISLVPPSISVPVNPSLRRPRAAFGEPNDR